MSNYSYDNYYRCTIWARYEKNLKSYYTFCLFRSNVYILLDPFIFSLEYNENRKDY